MQKRRRIVSVLLLALVGVIGYGAIQRPITLVALLHTPDEKHVHQVFAGNVLGQTITPTVNSIDGIRFWLTDEMATPDTAIITLHVRKHGQSNDIRTVSGPISQFHDTAQLEYYNETYSLLTSANTLYFPFERIVDSKDQLYDFVLSTDVPARQAIRIRYESDQKKFSQGQSFSSGGAEQGSLGFVLYERPNVATLAFRWLIDSRHTLIWPALGLVLFGALWWPKKNTAVPYAYGFHWPDIAWRSRTLWISIGLTVLAVAMYWPATDLFYYHDDLALLARGKHFQELGIPWKIFTAHDYLEVDEFSHFGFYFWRPISALYIWATHSIVGLTASWAYGINILLMGITAAGLFLVGAALLRSRIAGAVAAAIWLTHSTKIGVAYWWSESQAILAGLSTVISILLFLNWRQQPTAKHFLYWGLGMFAIGTAAKEYVFALPFVLFVISAIEQRLSITHLRQALRTIAPFLLVAGFMLAARTVALGDPTLPYIRRVDDTYEFTNSPIQIAKNVITYTAWSAEQWLWPKADNLERSLGTWLGQIRLQPPIYPGILLMAAYGAVFVVWRKNARIRKTLFLSIAWWALFLAPQLLLGYDWRSRWLYLSVFGIGLLVGLATTYIPKQFRLRTGVAILLMLSIYGTWQARLPERTRFYREQSAYIQEAVYQYNVQSQRMSAESTIYLVGVAEQETTSLNAYLFRLLSPYYPLNIQRQPTPPELSNKSDIIIDMRGIDAYYPEHER